MEKKILIKKTKIAKVAINVYSKVFICGLKGDYGPFVLSCSKLH